MNSATAAPPNGQINATVHDIRRVFDAQQAHKLKVRHTDADQRRAKIDRLRQALISRRKDIRAALYADFKKSPLEVDLTEVKAVIDEATFAMQHLASWMRPERVKTPAVLFGTQSEIQYQSKGVALIISPWNYPFNLTLGPLIGAIAAGNCAIIKPSEYTPNSSRLMASMIAELFDEREVALFEGDKDVSQELLALPFDHIYFTGSPAVGRIVMKAAAEHLASVTLELGGKSPTIVDETADVEDAAQKIAWGKFTNAGQTCIAPDYVYVHERVRDDFVAALRESIQTYYGDTEVKRRTTPDYARLVNDKHFDRVRRLHQSAVDGGARLIAGGDYNAEDRYFAPTVFTDVPEDRAIMQEEIFGPLLPVLTYRSLPDAIDAINERENPLALYLFTTSKQVEQTVIEHTTAGGTCINDVLLHYLNPHLPFGGAGNSGIGSGHGHYAFKEFSNKRSVLRRTAASGLVKKLYPPYGNLTRKLSDLFVRYL